MRKGRKLTWKLKEMRVFNWKGHGGTDSLNSQYTHSVAPTFHE